jgi:hypothetical protein
MTARYRPDTDVLRQAYERRLPFVGYGRTRAGFPGLELFQAAFPSAAAGVPVPYLPCDGELRIVVVNPTLRNPRFEIVVESKQKLLLFEGGGNHLVKMPLCSVGKLMPNQAFLPDLHLAPAFRFAASGYDLLETQLLIDGTPALLEPVASPIHLSDEAFISYAGTDVSKEQAAEICRAFQRRGISLEHYQDLEYKNDIAAFMDRLCSSRALIVVLSDAYLRSLPCMIELVTVADNSPTPSGFVERIFPVIMDDAKVIWDGQQRADYVKHWEDKRTALDTKLRQMEQHGQSELRTDLEQMVRVRARIDWALSRINEINVPDDLAADDYAKLVDAVTKRLNRTGQGP